jgi:hypothetical protein
MHDEPRITHAQRHHPPIPENPRKQQKAGGMMGEGREE